MKIIAAIVLLILTCSLLPAQPVRFAATRVKKEAREVITPDSLSKELIAGQRSEYDKVGAIFRWITDNIDYQVQGYYASRINNRKITIDDEDTGALKPLNERVAAGVLKRRMAVCDGYARLFKTLCDYAGIRSEVVTGYARVNGVSTGDKFKSNHAWNAVYFDSAWHLLDVTWASGYVSYANEYVRRYDSYYFLTPPRQFIQDHYPEDPKWTLLTDPPTLREFQRTPFKPMAFIKFKIQQYSPSKGIIEAAVGDTILFELETADAEKKLRISAEPFTDTTFSTTADSCTANEHLRVIHGSKVSYAYIVPPQHIKWLHVVYNDEIILRYKLSIRSKGNEEWE